ncbi:Ribulose bisphosphate carboxylase/oxygenase activase, chloroplastic-like protein [Drosera capensis]
MRHSSTLIPFGSTAHHYILPPMSLFFNSITTTSPFPPFPLSPHSSLKPLPHVNLTRSNLITRRNFAVRRRLNAAGSGNEDVPATEKTLSEQSSWEAKDAEGKDYLYRLGAEADNMNIAVGAKAGVVDHLFVGDFLGRDSDIVFDYRQKVTRSFEYLQGDYYIAPVFMDKVGKFHQTIQMPSLAVSYMDASRDDKFIHKTYGFVVLEHIAISLVCHIVKNFIAHVLDAKVPLILGVWGGKGQGKSFQTELIFQAMGIEPIIMSAGELESERAGEPGRLIRERYRTASQVVQNQASPAVLYLQVNVIEATLLACCGKMSCLMINDIDAGLGRYGNTQMTVNNQIVVGTLMNLSDNPTRVSIGQDWKESDITNRVPIIVTGNDFTTIYAPLIRDGRMEKFYWQPTHEDIVNIVYRMYIKDGISRDEVVKIVDTFPNQALDFYGALRSRTYDKAILEWVDKIGGVEKLGSQLLKRRKDAKLQAFVAPKQTIEALLESGYSLIEEQRLIAETRLSKEYIKNIDN